MSKCKKVKNPCKICLAPVTHKTGLQCQGACECWVHFTCLNYTPGKIKDIKAGLIKVNCPCPDCKSVLPKEIRTDLPFSCSSIKCPANYPPRCENTGCPINADVPNKINQACAPITKCGTDCKKHINVPGSPRTGSCRPRSGGIPPYAQLPSNPSDCLGGPPKCSSGCSSSGDVPGDRGQSPMDGFPSLDALEQMCNTVGQLTNQINCLMNKMKQAVQEKNGVGGNQRGCSQKGPKSMCPKPCYCPGNPSGRK